MVQFNILRLILEIGVNNKIDYVNNILFIQTLQIVG